MPQTSDPIPQTNETIAAGELLAFANHLADTAADVTLRHFRTAPAVDDKSGGGAALFDPVTEADRGAERAMVDEIVAHHPDHGIHGEEYGVRNAGAPLTWVLDPVDGTRGFVMGTPLWGTLIGLVEDGRARLGIMDQPYLGERFVGLGDRAEFRRNGGEPRPLVTSSRQHLADAYLTTTAPELFTDAPDADAFARLSAQTKTTRYGLDCYGYCLLAMGFIDVIAETGLKAYDIVALIPIIEGAGGVVTDWDGGTAIHGGRILASANAALHDQAMAVLNG